MSLRISSNSCPLDLLLVRSHQGEIIIVKRLIQGRNNVTRVRVEPISCDQGRLNLPNLAFYDYFQYRKTKCNLRLRGWTLQS